MKYADAVWQLKGSPSSNVPLFLEMMARGLYRLGIDNPEIWALLPLLSEHEQMELRQSMARESWPQTWLDKEVV